MNKIIFLSISLMLGMQHIHGSQESITTLVKRIIAQETITRKNGEKVTKTTSETYSITKFFHEERIVWKVQFRGEDTTITKTPSPLYSSSFVAKGLNLMDEIVIKSADGFTCNALCMNKKNILMDEIKGPFNNTYGETNLDQLLTKYNVATTDYENN